MPPKVLILDDQPTYLRALSRALRGDYDLITASTPGEAQAAAPADLAAALVDIRLDESRPDSRDGLGVIRWLRDNRAAVVVAMSALDDPGLPDEAVRCGAAMFFPKPIRVSDLLAALRAALTAPNDPLPPPPA